MYAPLLVGLGLCCIGLWSCTSSAPAPAPSPTDSMTTEAPLRPVSNLQDALWRFVQEWQDPMIYNDPEITGVYNPEIGGARSKYAVNKRLLPFLLLQQWTGEPVFLAGPHQAEMNFKSHSFGEYNPRFLQKLEADLKILFADTAFVGKAQSLYNRYFYRYIRGFALSHRFVFQNPQRKNAWIAAYRKAQKESPQYASQIMQEYFRDFSDEHLTQGYSWYETNTAAMFWLRRSMDKTDVHFFSLLQLVLQTLDPDFKANYVDRR